MMWHMAGTKFAIGGDWYVLDNAGRSAANRGQRVVLTSENGAIKAIVSKDDLDTLPAETRGISYLLADREED